ncbi:MAG: cytochrome c biogenesis protein [Spirochaetia bacterium]|nr:cytochrome c biogenesis protein [Spirochaetia bacterium]
MQSKNTIHRKEAPDLMSRVLPVWMIITFLLWSMTIYMTFLWVPSDTRQGIAQRIFYYHVPTAWVSGAGFAISFIFSIVYLLTRNLKYDNLAAAYATVGWVFTTGVLITGPLWAKPIWGAFWNWSDQRLISYFILWMAYAGYMLLRMGIADPQKRARFASILGIISFLDVPLVYAAIRIWNPPSHPKAVFGGSAKSGVFSSEMLITFLVSLIAFQLLSLLLSYLYYRFLEMERKILENKG